MLRNILLVAIGGAIGSVCRYLLSGINVASWPWGTFAVNILGSLFIGLFVGSGFCGGFTTFSTFANESFSMMKAGDALQMALYLGASVVIGILAVWLGMNVSDTIK